MPFEGKTFNLPKHPAAVGPTRTPDDWGRSSGGKAKKAAKAYAADYGSACVVWPSGNLSIYVKHGGEMILVRTE